MIVLVVLIVFVTLTVGPFLLGGGSGRRGPPDPTYPDTLTVDKALEAYIDITTRGGGGKSTPEGSWKWRYGTVSWIGSPQDSVKSIENIRLLMYVRDVSNETSPLLLGHYIHASLNDSQLPTDIIGYDEQIVPILGLDISSYDFTLNCSVRIP